MKHWLLPICLIAQTASDSSAQGGTSFYPIRIGDERYQLVRAYIEVSEETQQSCYAVVPASATVEVEMSPVSSGSLVVGGQPASAPPLTCNVLWRISVSGQSVSVGEGTLVFYEAGWDQHVFAPVVLSFDPDRGDFTAAAIARIASYQSTLKAMKQ